MKQVLFSALILATLGLSANSLAGSDSGFYVGGSFAQSSLDSSDWSFDDTSTGYKVILGYNFGLVPTLDIAVEANYRDFGSFGTADIDVDATSVDVYGLLGFNMGPVGLFAKYGQSDGDFSIDTDLGSASASDTSSTYGVGLKAGISSFAVRLEYEVIDADGLDDLSMMSVGATITF